MSTPKDKALERARKLYAIALDQVGKPEGDTAKGLAMALASKWNIPEAELQPTEGVVDDPLEVVIVEFGEPRMHARAMLLNVLATIADAVSTYRLRPPQAAGAAIDPKLAEGDAGSTSPDGWIWFGRIYADTKIKAETISDVFVEVEKQIVAWMEGSRGFAEVRDIANATAQSSRATISKMRANGQGDWADRIEAGQKASREAALRQLRIDWTMTVAVRLMEIWKSRQDKAQAADWGPPPAAEGALATVDRSLEVKSDMDKVKGAATKAANEPWTFDPEAMGYADELAERAGIPPAAPKAVPPASTKSPTLEELLRYAYVDPTPREKPIPHGDELDRRGPFRLFDPDPEPDSGNPFTAPGPFASKQRGR